MKQWFVIVMLSASLAACKGKSKTEGTPAGSGSAPAGSAAPAGSGSAPAGSAAAPGSGSAAAAGSAAGSGSAAAASGPTTYCGATPCPCKAGSEQKSGDKLSICDLEKTVQIGARSCEPGRVVFHESGALEECLLSADTEIGDYTCKKAPLSSAFHPDGTLRNCSLAKDATLGDFKLTAGRSIKLHADGKLRNAWLVDPVTVDGWSCTKNTYLFASGKLEACTVTKAGKVGTQDFPASSYVRIREDGTLRGLELGGPGKVAGKPAKANDRFCFEDGKVAATQSCWMF